MFHIQYTQGNNTLSFITSGMYSFYDGDDHVNDVIKTSKGIGHYNSCTHIKNVRIVPSMYAQACGKSIQTFQDGFAIRHQREHSGYIVTATTERNSVGDYYVSATATVIGPYWTERTTGWLSSIAIWMQGWSYSSESEAIDGISSYLDEVMEVNPEDDYYHLVKAIDCDLNIAAMNFGYMYSSRTSQWVTPWHVKMEASELTGIINHALSVALASYDETALLNQALESYRLDLGITKELVDTATGLAAVKSVADVAKALMPDSPRKFKTLGQFAKYLASTKLWYEYGCKLPAQTLKQWSTALKPEQIAKYCLSPGELRSGARHVSYMGHTLSDPETTVQISMDTRLGLGLRPQSTTIEFINSLYRYGVLMSLADGWDLIPLSFAVNWVTTLPQQIAEKLSNFADYWRFDYSYAKRTWKGHATFSGPYTVSFDFYIRLYSRDIPPMSIDKQIRLISDEGISGNLSLSSLDEALSLLTLLT